MKEILEWYNAKEEQGISACKGETLCRCIPKKLDPIPAETVRVARAACPKGTLAMRLRDALGELYQDEHFATLYPAAGPACILTVGSPCCNTWKA